jgi:hypothetical protein
MSVRGQQLSGPARAKVSGTSGWRGALFSHREAQLGGLCLDAGLRQEGAHPLPMRRAAAAAWQTLPRGECGLCALAPATALA